MTLTNWLIKRLAPDDADASDVSIRNACGRTVSAISICCNVMLALGKGGVGIATGSLAIAADAINNLADASSNAVSLIGFKLAAKPPDAEHPYGHGRYEYLAALFVAIGIVFVGVELIRNSFERIVCPAPIDASLVSMAVLIASIVIKLWMAHLNAMLGKHIGSSVLTATAADSLSDAAATTAVLATIVVQQLFGVNLDGWAGLGVGVLVTCNGIGLVRDTVDTLLGRGPSPELVDRIRKLIVGTPGVLGVHGLMIHDYGPGRLFGSAHIETDPNGNIVASHELVDAIERKLWNAEHIVMTLHVDPFERGNGSATDLLMTSDKVEGNVFGDTRDKPQRKATMGYKSKQMIVVRRDLKMRKGKIAAQAGHACVEATLMALAHEGRLDDVRMSPTNDWVYLDGDNSSDTTPLTSWFDAGVAKVCVYVDGEDALLDLAVRGRELGFLCALIRDVGLTEFGGEATYTCLAFEPLYPEQIDPLTGELPLY